MIAKHTLSIHSNELRGSRYITVNLSARSRRPSLAFAPGTIDPPNRRGASPHHPTIPIPIHLY